LGSAIIGGREFRLPILVPSISSFETPISLTGAVSIQFALQEPISLISAFDFHNEQEDFRSAVHSFAKSGALLVDSGGYESQRIRKSERYYPKDIQININWNEDLFFESLKCIEFSYAFSYDYYHTNKNIDLYRTTLLNAINQHVDLFGTRIIPVIHALEESRPGVAKPARLPDEELIRLCIDVANAFAPDSLRFRSGNSVPASPSGLA
jgi:hypothetical protein